jgi:glycosyltransferase involved in cell wall biosynthesis
MVFDVPAENGGALTILNQYYVDAVNDHKNEWVFVISTPTLLEHTNVKVLNFPWIKKSWIHRLFFDWFVAYKLVEKHKVDEVLSLQDVIIRKTKVKQVLYLHLLLPFIEKRYKITENFKFWVYQNIISVMIFDSVKKADVVIVQTKWIEDTVTKKVGVSDDKFIVQSPKINISVKLKYCLTNESVNVFFYPSSAFVYKNHDILIKACQSLKARGIENYRLILTLKGDENKSINSIRDTIIKDKLPIEFIGSIPIEKVYDYYSKSTLIFPSYLETFGLPLLEAKMHNTPILASNCEFSHEILDTYDNVSFFDPFNSKELSILMERKLTRRIN